jgi:type IV pilus assembly protein PilP
MMNSVSLKNSFLVVALIASVCFPGPWDTASAQDKTDALGITPSITADAPAQDLEAALVSGRTPPFIYDRARPDPFFPFLTQEIMKAEAKAKSELTGTRKFEPGQLTLVAIVSGRGGFVAMVQDASGVGYVLRKGTAVGETGKVIQIDPNKVVIEQSLKNVVGERISRTVEMILNKEGENQ